MAALENGFHPWWNGTRDVSLKWRASAEMKFVSAPEGFSSEGGWWTSVSGVTSALGGLGGESSHGPGLPDGVLSVGSDVEFEWTRAKSQAQFGAANLVKSVVFPCAVTGIGEKALSQFGFLESVVFPAGCVDFGKWAFACCKALRAVSFPVGCKATGHYAFADCTSLVSAWIPAGCLTLSANCFSCSTSLTGVKFPDGLTSIGKFAFWRCALKEVELRVGCEIAEYAFRECKALKKVTIGRDCTSIGEWAFSDCEALTKVAIGDGLKLIGGYAFDCCSVLATVALPASVQSIGENSFGGCTSLATIAIPNACQLHCDTFWNCSPRVSWF
jgi:hypothetical protein